MGEVVVGEMELHAAAGGEGVDFVEVGLGTSSEKGFGEMVEPAGSAKVVHGLVEVGAVSGGAAEREVIEADIERPEVLDRPPERSRRAAVDFRSLALGQQEVAVSVALE